MPLAVKCKTGGDMAEQVLYRREKVAERFGISVREVDRLLANKELRSLKIGKRRLVSEEAILSFIRRREAAER
jgi:excisionase family DNA binding protein